MGLKPRTPALLQVTAEVAEQARALEFTSTMGGPLILIAEVDLPSWFGACDERGTFIDEPGDADYWRACENRHKVVESISGVPALVLDGPDPHAFFSTDAGGMFCVWVGCDTEAGILTVALSHPDESWEPMNTRWRARHRRHVLVDAVVYGAKPHDLPSQIVELEPGDYALTKSPYFQGSVRHPDGTIEELWTYALRLEPVGAS